MQPIPKTMTKTNNQLIQKWLNERQLLIVSFNHLCSLRPFTADVCETLQEFCQLLVDYVSLGHFEVYEHIVNTVEQCQQPKVQIPKRLLQALMDTTVCALDFNDKYQIERKIDHLDADLSKLGLRFAERLEWEDSLLEAYNLAKAWGYQQAKTA
jgi:regulator of sigma D